MPTYIYETIPENANDHPQYFEVLQGAAEPLLTVHPVTGVPIRRVNLGGPAILDSGTFDPGTAEGAGCCGE